MRTLDESLQRQLGAEAVRLADGIQSGDVDFLWGVRRLAALRFDIFSCERDEDFLLFAGIDSETDHLPHIGMRDTCAPAWLEKCDQEISDVESLYRQSVSAACKRISSRFTSMV
jgi:hypothetical protein